MPHLIELRDRARIEAYLREDPALHLYELGDLDPFFWPATRWFGLEAGADRLEALALLYQGPEVSTLLALDRRSPSPLPELLGRLAQEPAHPGAPPLPDRLHAHLSPGLADALAPRLRSSAPVPALRLALAEPARLGAVPDLDAPDLIALDLSHQAAAMAFYAEAYPGNWFDRRMLETGCYVGLLEDGSLAAVAGVHVYSPTTRVAALGNVATHPRARRRGYGRRVTARLCRDLCATVDVIGLNVYEANTAAIALYTDLGFAPVARYEERWLEVEPSLDRR